MTQLTKISYTHDALIDLVIASPGVSQNELARHFGYTPGWVSQMMSSDAFKARLTTRKAELVDPILVASVTENLEAVAQRSMVLLQEKLDSVAVPPSADVLLKALEISTRALGYGARGAAVQINQQFVALVPEKSADAQTWEGKYAPVEAPA